MINYLLKQGKGFVVGTLLAGSSVAYFNGEKKETHSNVETYIVSDTAKHFVTWFNTNQKASHKELFPIPIDSVGFVNMSAHLSELAGQDTIQLQEFICYFCTIYNETGGKMKSVSEYGNDAYFFNRLQLSNGKWKASYNHISGNQPAGSYLVQKGYLHPVKDSARVRVWNGNVYPINEPNHIKLAARNADFYKFRGQGQIQITGRLNFNRFVLPVLPEMHELTSLQLDSAFQQPNVYLGATRNYLSANRKVWNAIWTKINVDNPQWDAFGHAISGSAQYHNFANRCQAIWDAVLSNGFDKIFSNK